MPIQIIRETLGGGGRGKGGSVNVSHAIFYFFKLRLVSLLRQKICLKAKVGFTTYNYHFTVESLKVFTTLIFDGEKRAKKVSRFI